MSNTRQKSAAGAVIVLAGLAFAAVACTASESEAQQAGAMQSRMTLEDLVSRSVLVVIGELTAVRADEGSAPTVDVGTLRVDEVLYARVKPAVPIQDATLVLPSRGGLMASDMVFYTVGQKGIWFLREAPGSERRYLADNSQRLQPLAEADRVRSIVKSRDR